MIPVQAIKKNATITLRRFDVDNAQAKGIQANRPFLARSHFFLLTFAAIRALSIFFRRWANLVAGLRTVGRPFPAIGAFLSDSFQL